MGKTRLSSSLKPVLKGVFVTPCATLAQNSLKECRQDAWKLATHGSAAVDDLAADIG